LSIGPVLKHLVFSIGAAGRPQGRSGNAMNVNHRSESVTTASRPGANSRVLAMGRLIRVGRLTETPRLAIRP
jgi:hypothetical protein